VHELRHFDFAREAEGKREFRRVTEYYAADIVAALVSHLRDDREAK